MTALRHTALAFVATWRAMLGDTAALTLLFAGGLVYSFFYPLPYSRENVQQVPIAIVDQDHSALSRQITRYAAAHPNVSLPLVTPDPNEAREALWRNEVAGTLLIPAGLQTTVLAGRKAEVVIAGNGLYMMMNKAALNGLAEAVGTVSAGVEVKRLEATTPSPGQALEQRQPVTVNAVALFNVREGYGSYIVPAVAVLIVQQTLVMAIALMFGTWFERGGSPLPRTTAAYAGMVGAFASVAAINCLYYFGFVLWWQDYPRGGNLAGLLLFVALFAIATSAFGVMVGTLFRSRERSAQLLLCAALPLMFLSGISWPVQALPPLLQALRWAVPSTAGIQGFVALNQLGASLHEVRTEAAALAALGAVSLVIGLWRWRRGEANAPVAASPRS